MIVSNDQIFDRIDEIVERSYVDFTFDLIGADFFTEEQKLKIESLGLIIGRRPMIELLYILVRQRSTPGYRTDKTLNELLNEIQETGVLPIINDTHRYSVDHSKAEMNEAIEGSKAEIKKKIKQTILSVNNDYKNDVAISRITSLGTFEQKKADYTGLILLGLAGLSLGFHKQFMAAFTTSITNTVNNAVVDEAATQIAVGEKPSGVLVYKQVINDSSLCQWCSSFYTNSDGSPKLYTLLELQSYGSNLGKPKSSWKPTIDATHPRCRCQLQYKTR